MAEVEDKRDFGPAVQRRTNRAARRGRVARAAYADFRCIRGDGDAGRRAGDLVVSRSRFDTTLQLRGRRERRPRSAFSKRYPSYVPTVISSIVPVNRVSGPMPISSATGF
ncbi:MAG: hypothetical protein ACREXX_08670 [Gammaproteobacteria bacterium]